MRWLLVLVLSMIFTQEISSSTWTDYFVYCERTLDFNNDGIIDGADLGSLLGAWGTPCGDINYDGTTDAEDLGILLSKFGTSVESIVVRHDSGDGSEWILNEYVRTGPSPLGTEYTRYWRERYFKITLEGVEERYKFAVDHDNTKVIQRKDNETP